MQPSVSKPSLPNFIRVVLSHWVGLMSGGVIIVADGVWERLTGQNVPLHVYLIIVLLFIVLACFLAWKDAHNEMRVRQAEAEKEQAILKSQLDIKDIQLKHVAGEQERLTQEHEEAKEYIEHLEERLAPKLEILFEDRVPFVEFAQERSRIGRDGYYKILRVGVKNVSADELYNVTVELENFEMHGRSFEAVPLRRMYNVKPPYQESFRLQPDRTEYVDVVMRSVHDEPRSTYLCLTRSFEIFPALGEPWPHTLTIVASAGGAQPCRRRFTVFFDDEDQLQMKPNGD